MNEAYNRKKHRRLPRHLHRVRGPAPYVGEQRSTPVATTVRDLLGVLAGGGPIGPVTRQAYALGRAALMARLAAGDRWDEAHKRGGLGPLTSVALPLLYIRGWPPLKCTHGAACRLAIDIGVGLLEFEHRLKGWVTIHDERSVDIIAPEHHPGRYTTECRWVDPEPFPPEAVREIDTPEQVEALQASRRPYLTEPSELIWTPDAPEVDAPELLEIAHAQARRHGGTWGV